jgi:hypothetical protein
VRHGRGQVNVAHALAPHRRAGDLNAALVANDALITDVLVLAAVTLPVLGRTENGLAEQTILLRPQAPVVDGFWLEYFTVRPTFDLFRRGKTYPERTEALGFQHLPTTVPISHMLASQL